MTWLMPLLGGVIIGLAASLLLWSYGRIAGITGILAGVFDSDKAWRLTFLGGLVVGGVLMSFFTPGVFGMATGRSLPVLLLAGLTVGYGARMGGGCTSGHGVCGNASLSPRSLVATCVFVGAGMLTATLLDPFLAGVQP